jgi:glucose-1-phosphate adenylyltransferase
MTRSRDPRVLAFVMAGGEGTRLMPLTSDRSKPAVPFGGRHRLVDFVLSNLVNSGIHAIYLLVQYKSQSLIEHIQRSWTTSPIFPQQFITVVPPQMAAGPEWFQGTADAVAQNVNLIEQYHPDVVAVFGADHVYRMDVRQMVDFHLETRADATVAALPVPRADASAFGVIDAADDGRIRSFLEKPASPPPMPGDPDRAYASMGNYIFSTDLLLETLHALKSRNESDFGKHVLPRLSASHRVFAYDFARNEVPGVRPYEERAYWRDVGTIDAYFHANMDMLGHEPRFNLFNPRWRVGSSNYQGPASRFLDARLDNVIVSSGCVVDRATVRNSIIRREVVIQQGAELEDCIVMDFAHICRNVKLRRVIIDRYNTLREGERIGYDLEADRACHFVTESGISVVKKGDHRLYTEQGEPARFL